MALRPFLTIYHHTDGGLNCKFTNWFSLFTDEIFVDFGEGNLTHNRVYAGFKTKLMKHLNVDMFYMWQKSKKGADWFNHNIIGAKLKVKC